MKNPDLRVYGRSTGTAGVAVLSDGSFADFYETCAGEGSVCSVYTHQPWFVPMGYVYIVQYIIAFLVHKVKVLYENYAYRRMFFESGADEHVVYRENRRSGGMYRLCQRFATKLDKCRDGFRKIIFHR